MGLNVEIDDVIRCRPDKFIDNVILMPVDDCRHLMIF
jgi:hypothetical protein